MYKTQSNIVSTQMCGKSNKKTHNRKISLAMQANQNESKVVENAPKKKSSFVIRRKLDEVATVIEKIKADDTQV